MKNILALLFASLLMASPVSAWALSNPPNCPTSGGTQALNYTTATNAFSCNAVTGSGGTVTSVSGTSNRITSTGGTTPVIDISASYVGQSSITTVGTLSAGTVPTTLLSGTLQAATATALQNARTIGAVSFDGTANIVPQTIQTVDDTSDTTTFVLFGNASGSQTSGQQPKTNSALGFNASTGALSATSFSGAGTGLTGTAASLTAGTASAVAVGGITGLGTGIATALAVNTGSAGAPVLFNGAGGTPSSMTATNLIGTATALNIGGNAATATSATTATTATNATNGATVATTTNASFFPLFAASSSNSNQPFNLDTTLTYNPSTDTLTATNFAGNATTATTTNLGTSTSATSPRISGDATTGLYTSGAGVINMAFGGVLGFGQSSVGLHIAGTGTTGGALGTTKTGAGVEDLTAGGAAGARSGFDFDINNGTTANVPVGIVYPVKENSTVGNNLTSLRFGTHNGTNIVDQMTIFSGGQIGMGTTTPSSGYELDVRKTAAANNVVRIQNNSSTGFAGTDFFNDSGTYVGFIAAGNSGASLPSQIAAGSITALPLVFYTNSAEVGRFASGGVLSLSTVNTGTNTNFLCASGNGPWTVLRQTSACTISSIRFKDNLKAFAAAANYRTALEEIAELHPVTFTMKRPQGKQDTDPNAYAVQIGLTAENVAKIDPRAAVYEQDGKTPKSYRQESIIAMLVKGMQEQQGQIDELKKALAGHSYPVASNDNNPWEKFLNKMGWNK